MSDDGLNLSEEDIDVVERRVNEIAHDTSSASSNSLSVQQGWQISSLILHIIIYNYQCSGTCTTGTKQFIEENPKLTESDLTIVKQSDCRKDLGERSRLRHWSRGHVFIVHCCGHIDTWKPIFKYENVVHDCTTYNYFHNFQIRISVSGFSYYPCLAV